MQQLGLGLAAAAAAEDSPAGGVVCAAAEGHVAAAAAPVTPLPATEIAAGQPAGGPTAAAAAAAVPPLPLDPTLLSDLCCPITHEPMSDPVVAADGTTYERAAIEGGWGWECVAWGVMLAALKSCCMRCSHFHAACSLRRCAKPCPSRRHPICTVPAHLHSPHPSLNPPTAPQAGLRGSGRRGRCPPPRSPAPPCKTCRCAQT